MRDRIERLARLRALPADAPAALATVVRVEGSSYRREGARLLIEADGRLTGLISGGCLERDLAARASEWVSAAAPTAVVYDLTDEREAIWGFGTGCPGRVTLWIEPLDAERRRRELELLVDLVERRRERRIATCWSLAAPPSPTVAATAAVARRLAALAPGEIRPDRVDTADGPVEVLLERLLPAIHLLIVGAGPDTRPLADLAERLGWHVTRLDPRDRPPGDCLAGVELSPRTAVLLATHRYLDDLAALEVAAPHPVGYLAALGATARRERLLGDLALRAPQLAAALEGRLRGPAGLDLGGRAPEEVALSIVAEIQACFAARDARPLSTVGPAAQREPAPRPS